MVLASQIPPEKVTGATKGSTDHTLKTVELIQIVLNFAFFFSFENLIIGMGISSEIYI